MKKPVEIDTFFCVRNTLSTGLAGGGVLRGSAMVDGLIRFLRGSVLGAPLECLERIPDRTGPKWAKELLAGSWPIFCNLTPMTALRLSWLCSPPATGNLNEWRESFFIGEVGGRGKGDAVGVKLRVRATDDEGGMEVCLL